MNRENKKAHPNKDEQSMFNSSNRKDNTNTPESQEKNIEYDRFNIQKKILKKYAVKYCVVMDHITNLIEKHFDNDNTAIAIYYKLLKYNDEYNTRSKRSFSTFVKVNYRTLKKVIDKFVEIGIAKLEHEEGSKKQVLKLNYEHTIDIDEKNEDDKKGKLPQIQQQITSNTTVRCTSSNLPNTKNQSNTNNRYMPKESYKESTKEHDSLYRKKNILEEETFMIKEKGKIFYDYKECKLEIANSVFYNYDKKIYFYYHYYRGNHKVYIRYQQEIFDIDDYMEKCNIKNNGFREALVNYIKAKDKEKLMGYYLEFKKFWEEYCDAGKKREKETEKTNKKDNEVWNNNKGVEQIMKTFRQNRPLEPQPITATGRKQTALEPLRATGKRIMLDKLNQLDRNNGVIVKKYILDFFDKYPSIKSTMETEIAMHFRRQVKQPHQSTILDFTLKKIKIFLEL